MTARFMTADEINRPLPLSVGISGGSGTGKTYSALLLARGIATELAGPGAPIAFVDTENRRGLHYRDAFPEILDHYVSFGPEVEGKMVGFPPERWIELLDFVEGSGAKALVIDSFSSAWEGINGVLDLQAAELDRLSGGDEKKAERVGQLAWAQVKPRYRRLINRMIQSSVPTIICTRAKPVMQNPDYKGGGNARTTKTRRKDVPWDVAGDADMIFEVAAMVILDPAHPGCPLYQIKVADQFKGILRPDRPISEATGQAMAKWSKRQSNAHADKAMMDAARATARQGSAAMRDYWKALDAGQQSVIRAILKELQETAATADQAQTQDEDPFADRPTPEHLAAAEAAARGEAAAQAQED